ncbi:unnamed protein product, partial [marine sediment metagenome]
PFPFNVIAAFIYILFTIGVKIIIKLKFHYNLFLIDLLKGKKYYNKYFRGKDKLDLP